MLYKWKQGSVSQDGKIVLRAGDFIPEGLLTEESLERFIKKGSIEVIEEPKAPKKAKKPVKKAGPAKDEPDIEELM